MGRKPKAVKAAELDARGKFLATLPKQLASEADCERHDGLVAAGMLEGVITAGHAEILLKRSSQALRGMRQRAGRRELDELRELLAEAKGIRSAAGARGAAARGKTR